MTNWTRAEAMTELRRLGVDVIGHADAPWNRDTGGTVWNAAINARRPSPVLEPPPASWGYGNGVKIDRYDLNPGLTFVKAILPGVTFVGAPPTMFSSGDLPIFTASGIDPELLLWVPWKLRHTAALTESRGRVLALVEEGDDPEPHRLQTRDGRFALRDYVSRMYQWAVTPPPQPLSDGEIEALFPPGSTPELAT
jgi:hypothetical protein